MGRIEFDSHVTQDYFIRKKLRQDLETFLATKINSDGKLTLEITLSIETGVLISDN